jgi:hypothetical protein
MCNPKLRQENCEFESETSLGWFQNEFRASLGCTARLKKSKMNNKKKTFQRQNRKNKQ